MKHLATMLVVLAVLGLMSSSTIAGPGETYIFQQNTDTNGDGSGDYLWIAENWWLTSWTGGPAFQVPDAGSECRISTIAVLDGQDGFGNIGLGDGGTGELTVKSGTLSMGDADAAYSSSWVGNDSTMNVQGGTVSFGNGFFVGRSGDVGTLNMTGGTMLGLFNTTVNQWGSSNDAPFGLGTNGTTGYGVANISGGVIDLADKGLHVGHQNGHNSQSLLIISGDAVVNEHSTGGWNGGTQVWGGTYRVIGGDATIDASVFYLGGQGIAATGSSLEFQIDATGISTINIAGSLTIRPDSILDIQANSAANGTYTLIHSSNDPTAQLTNLTFAADANVSDPIVVDVAGDGSLGYDINVEYTGGTVVIRQMGDVNLSGLVDGDDLSLLLANWGLGGSPAPQAVPEPATLLLVAFGGLALIRKRR